MFKFILKFHYSHLHMFLLKFHTSQLHLLKFQQRRKQRVEISMLPSQNMFLLLKPIMCQFMFHVLSQSLQRQYLQVGSNGGFLAAILSQEMVLKENSSDVLTFQMNFYPFY